MSMLEELYFDYIKGEVYKGNDENEETIRKYKLCEDVLNNPDVELKYELPDLIVEYAVAREELGFKNGFQYAVQIMLECFSKKVVLRNE